MSRGFFSAELEAAWDYLDRYIQANRRSTGMAEGHKGFLIMLRGVRNSIEEADIELQNNATREGAA